MSLRSTSKRFRPIIDRFESRALMTAAGLAGAAPVHHFQAHVAQAKQIYYANIYNNTTQDRKYDLRISAPGEKERLDENNRVLMPQKTRQLDWKSSKMPTIEVGFFRYPGKREFWEWVPVSSKTGTPTNWKFDSKGRGVNEVVSLVPA